MKVDMPLTKLIIDQTYINKKTTAQIPTSTLTATVITVRNDITDPSWNPV